MRTTLDTFVPLSQPREREASKDGDNNYHPLSNALFPPRGKSNGPDCHPLNQTSASNDRRTMLITPAHASLCTAWKRRPRCCRFDSQSTLQAIEASDRHDRRHCASTDDSPRREIALRPVLCSCPEARASIDTAFAGLPGISDGMLDARSTYTPHLPKRRCDQNRTEQELLSSSLRRVCAA